MKLSNLELVLVGVALTALMMLGTTNVRTKLSLYRLHTLLIAVGTAWVGYLREEPSLYFIASVIVIVKAWGLPWYLSRIIRSVGVQNDSAVFIPTAVAMH